ncbi:recombinase family protein [Chitinophaga agrisoli]|uniref:Recombinase family protein n=1 Tax=Chitinophaga agrisoli TaxID=2607653 RepID=A0A5B2VRS6_9BACT|nr:recombinase family protein [Chitinophaga agrisoli]KAA2241534.1 recombinase family protein [Chitinophaga agrisoli]
MSNIDYFKRFIPKSNNEEKPNYEVWSYTRVSSKDQFDRNSSVINQINANREYASKNNYHITEEFGGTYESAKTILRGLNLNA